MFITAPAVRGYRKPFSLWVQTVAAPCTEHHAHLVLQALFSLDMAVLLKFRHSAYPVPSC
jgi:hypothetical protein